MTDLTISEAYFLFALNEKGKLSGYDSAKVACLLTAALYELSMEGSVTFAEKRIYLSKCAPDKEFLTPLYHQLTQMDSLTFRDIYGEYASSISGWCLNTFTSALGRLLEEKGYVTRAKVGFIGARTYYIPHKGSVPSAAAEFSIDLLYQTPPSPEDCLLWFLLEQSECIPSFFSDDQRSDIHNKVASEIRTNEKLKQLIDYANQLLSLVRKNKLQFEYY
ncbi:MAG: GPP34 family phosphoprotein [Eubacteriales bacterium]|nr:GPP34 family phosphoprotein [Eubacteriales bacterium]